MARLLLIDDEKQQLMLRATILQAHGYEVETAQGGCEAMELFKQQHFDLVITDWLMPSITGLDISKQLKNYRPNTPIIMLTGWGNLLSNENLKENAVDCLLSKPCDAEKLLENISAILAIYQGLAADEASILMAAESSRPWSLN